MPQGRRWPWCPGRGTCVNGMGNAREEMSLHSHLVLSLLFVSLSRMGFAGTPVPCSAVPEGPSWGSRQIQLMFLLISDFSPTEKHPLFRRGGNAGLCSALFLYKVPSLQSFVCIHGDF